MYIYICPPILVQLLKKLHILYTTCIYVLVHRLQIINTYRWGVFYQKERLSGIQLYSACILDLIIKQSSLEITQRRLKHTIYNINAIFNWCRARKIINPSRGFPVDIIIIIFFFYYAPKYLIVHPWISSAYGFTIFGPRSLPFFSGACRGFFLSWGGKFFRARSVRKFSYHPR